MSKGAAMGLLSALLGMMGCHQAPIKEQAKENPAPKPPRCPDLPELKNVTMEDGRIADVRIIRIGKTNLYFPADWLTNAFLDAPSTYPWEQREGKRSAGMTIPDLYHVECPGVVHNLNIERETPRIGIPMGNRVSSMTYVENGIKLNEIRAISLSTSDMPPGSHRWVMHTSGAHPLWLVPLEDVMLYAFVTRDVAPNKFRGQKAESKSLTELVQWLATPPPRRDNDRIFTVQIDKVAQ